MAKDELGFELEGSIEDETECKREGCSHAFVDHDDDTGICEVDDCECEEFLEEEEE